MTTPSHAHATIYIRTTDGKDGPIQEALAHRIATAAGYPEHTVIKAEGPLDAEGYGPGVPALLAQLAHTDALVTIGLDRLTASLAAGRKILDAVDEAGVELIVSGGRVDRQVAETVWWMVDPKSA